MKELTGTPRQISWAASIRTDRLAAIETGMADLARQRDEQIANWTSQIEAAAAQAQTEEQCTRIAKLRQGVAAKAEEYAAATAEGERLIEALRNVTSAAWWIEHRTDSSEDLLRAM